MAIEIKKQKRKIKWFVILFIICAIMLLIFSASFLFFYLETKENKEKIDDLKTKIEKQTLREDLVEVEKNIKRVKSVLLQENIIEIRENKKGEKIAFFTELEINKIIPFLTDHVHPKAFFSSLSFDYEQGKVDIQGDAEDLIAFRQQLFILEKELDNNFNLIGYTINEDQNVSFDFDFNIDTLSSL